MGRADRQRRLDQGGRRCHHQGAWCGESHEIVPTCRILGIRIALFDPTVINNQNPFPSNDIQVLGKMMFAVDRPDGKHDL